MSLFNTGIRPAVDEYLAKEAEKVRDYGDYWSASSAGYCKRKVIFDRLGVPPVKEDARKTRVFESGHIFHEWLQRITKNAGLSIAQELELQDEELMVRGHIDDLVLIKGDGVVSHSDNMDEPPKPDHLILYDYKTAHSRSFTYTKDRPMSHYHRYQLGTYMLILRRLMSAKVVPAELDNLPELIEGRILSVSKDDLRMSEKQLLWDNELEKEVIDYWTELNQLWAERQLPPCTCANHEGGFMSREQYNPYFYQGEPCSVAWLSKCKEEGLLNGSKQNEGNAEN